MKRAVLTVLVTMLPVTAIAQDAPAQPASGSDTPVAAAAAASTEDASQPRIAGRGGTKRRGSMVGYIEDPTVGSGFRIRFDSGWDMSTPDRAEFFYAKCGCYRTLPASNAAYDPTAPGPGPGVLEGLNFNQLYLMSEYRAGRHASVFAELPYRWIKPTGFIDGTGSFGNQSGLGDIHVGAKFALISNSNHDVTVMLRAGIPTGDSTKGLGTDHGSIEPALLVRQSLGGRAQIEGMFGDVHPTGSSKGPVAGSGDFAGDVLYYGIGPSFDLVQTRKTRIAPVVELVGWHVLGGFDTLSFVTTGNGDASGINVVNLKIGGRVSMANGGSFYVGWGTALTDNVWYDHILRLEYRTKF